MNTSKLKNQMELRLEFLLLLEKCRKILSGKDSKKEKKISECVSKTSFFGSTINADEIIPKKDWIKKFDKYWIPSEENALKELKIFISDRVDKYSNARNFPNLIGTSRLSPFIKHGQIHVETIWRNVQRIRKRY